MHAAIKVLEDTLLIRRLQARELEHEKDNAARIKAINEDIASLERGLAALEAVRDQRSEVSQHSEINNQQSKIENSPRCPTIGDLPGKSAGGVKQRPEGE